MAGERKKPTAAEKGRGVMVEEKKRESLGPRRSARNSAAPTGMAGPPATSSESLGLRRSTRTRSAPTGMAAPISRKRARAPISRKRAQDDNVVPGPRPTPYTGPPTPPSPPAIVDGDDYLGMFSKALSSVVTVAFHMSVGDSTVTSYRTGFILVDEQNYSVVLTTSKPCSAGKVNNFFIYFGGEMSQTEAFEIDTIPEENLLILLVRTNKRHVAVNLSSEPLAYEVIFTVCAVSGRKLNDKANAPVIKELEGKLGFYKGTVGTPTCYALDAAGEYIDGSANYFQLGFCLHDDIITLENVDAKRHTAEIAMSAPIFRLNGQTAGIVFSDGGWPDSKIGLLATRIISCLKTKFGQDEWELELKKHAEDWQGSARML